MESADKEHKDKEDLDLEGTPINDEPDLENQSTNNELNEELEAQLKESKEKYLRSLAEIENTRKRMQKERQDMTKFALDNVFCDFLEPLDSFSKALGFAKNMSDEVKNWAIGFEMILKQFENVLEEHKVKRFESLGQPFDPEKHEAVEVEETDETSEGTILEVFDEGYLSGERVLRPAKVKVAKPKVKENLEEENKKA